MHGVVLLHCCHPQAAAKACSLALDDKLMQLAFPMVSLARQSPLGQLLPRHSIAADAIGPRAQSSNHLLLVYGRQCQHMCHASGHSHWKAAKRAEAHAAPSNNLMSSTKIANSISSRALTAHAEADTGMLMSSDGLKESRKTRSTDLPLHMQKAYLYQNSAFAFPGNATWTLREDSLFTCTETEELSHS